MEKLLLMQVHFLDDRYHGEGDWPPAPARLFQALVAGNAVGDRLPEECAEALRWLESVPTPPEIRAQRGCWGLRYTTFVPNNDLDAKGGDPREAMNIRVGKSIQPRHIDAARPIVYAWRFAATDAAVTSAQRVCAMADNVYQLGRGVDMAWAHAEILDIAEGEAALNAANGEVFYPGSGHGEVELECPRPGSLDSLIQRYHAHRERFARVREGSRVKILFANPPKPRFQRVSYNPLYQWRLFDLRKVGNVAEFHAWPLEQIVALVSTARNKAAERLIAALPEQAADIERFLVGRNAAQADKTRRARLIPLPSIGHEMTNHAIRRLMVMVPPDCPLRFADVEWAFSGLIMENEPADTILVRADDFSMLRHYGVESGESRRLWRSVTPVALPQSAARRRVDPRHRAEQAKPGSERAAEEQRACAAVIQALRHAGVTAGVETIHVQREPFSGRGERAEAFAESTRFAKERLWHLELRFTQPLEGPLLIGDGRYLGLGLMAPERESIGVLAYRIENGLAAAANPEQLAQALRRAVMARVQLQLGYKALPAFFTGHAPNGSPLRDGNHRHLAFVADVPARRLMIVAPHLLEDREPYREERLHLNLLDLAMQGMCTLKAGPAGYLDLAAVGIDWDRDPLFKRSKTWETVTAYRPTRYAKRSSPADALTEDVLREVERRGLSRPAVEVLSVREGPRGGLEGHFRLKFPRAQSGPLIFGRTCHLGGGLLRAV